MIIGEITKRLKKVDQFLFAEKIPGMIAGTVYHKGIPYNIYCHKPGVRVCRASQQIKGHKWVIADFTNNESIESIKNRIRNMDRSKLGVLGELEHSRKIQKAEAARRRSDMAHAASVDIYNSLNKTYL